MDKVTATNKIAIPAVFDGTNDNAVHHTPIAMILNTNESEISKSKYSLCNYFIHLKTQHIINVTTLKGTVRQARCTDVAALLPIDSDKHDKEILMESAPVFINP